MSHKTQRYLIEQKLLKLIFESYAMDQNTAKNLHPDIFKREEHRAICHAIADLVNKQRPVDLVMISAWISNYTPIKEICRCLNEIMDSEIGDSTIEGLISELGIN